MFQVGKVEVLHLDPGSDGLLDKASSLGPVVKSMFQTDTGLASQPFSNRNSLSDMVYMSHYQSD
jgi:hypothetical protein